MLTYLRCFFFFFFFFSFYLQSNLARFCNIKPNAIRTFVLAPARTWPHTPRTFFSSQARRRRQKVTHTCHIPSAIAASKLGVVTGSDTGRCAFPYFSTNNNLFIQHVFLCENNVSNLLYWIVRRVEDERSLVISGQFCQRRLRTAVWVLLE